MDILDFLLSNDVIIKSSVTGRMMTADALFDLNGEFVVYENGVSEFDDYRGTNFDEAMMYLQKRG